MLICFSGFQSTGETTATFELAKILKRDGHSTNVWTDIPRRCPLKINERGTPDTQFWIASRMVTETIELLNIYDYLVTDRTPLDCVAYEMATHELRTGNKEITEAALTLYNFSKTFLKYQQAEILWVESGFGYKDEVGRSNHSEFKELSGKWFKEVYEMAKNDLNIRSVDMRYLDLDKLATELIQEN